MVFYNYSTPLRAGGLLYRTTFFACDHSWYASPAMYRPLSLPLTYILLLQAAAFEWPVCNAVSPDGASFRSPCPPF